MFDVSKQRPALTTGPENIALYGRLLNALLPATTIQRCKLLVPVLSLLLLSLVLVARVHLDIRVSTPEARLRYWLRVGGYGGGLCFISGIHSTCQGSGTAGNTACLYFSILRIFETHKKTYHQPILSAGQSGSTVPGIELLGHHLRPI